MAAFQRRPVAIAIREAGASSSGIDVAIVDQGCHGVHLFDSRGAHRRLLGTKGDSIGELRDPRGGCFTPEGKICVADTMNDRIQTFDLNGQPLSSFGERGNKLGQLSFPADVQYIGSDLMIVDSGNCRVQIFYGRSDEVSRVVRTFHSLNWSSSGGADVGNGCASGILLRLQRESTGRTEPSG